MLAFGLASCGPKPGEAALGCTQLRERFDKAFNDSVVAATRKDVDEKERLLRIGQDTYATMERQGCCRQENVCPPLNVH